MMVTDRIEINPKIMLGKAVIRGTRIPVELLLRKLSEGATEADLLDAYPGLAVEDIKAAVGYAEDLLELRKAKRAERKKRSTPLSKVKRDLGI